LHHLAYAPYAVPHEDVSAAVTALQSTNAPLGAGFGVTCRRGSGRDRVAYEFIVERGSTGGLWYIERRNGIPSTTSPPLVLRKGTADKVPGNTALSLTGACITNRSGHTTRLALFVDDKQLAAIDDVTPGLSADGWSTGIVVASEAAAASTVTVTKFIVRDLQ
jgi:hypothetical protein